MINNNVCKLFHRIFRTNTPARDLQMTFLSHYLSSGQIIKGTILHKLVSIGVSPTHCAFHVPKNEPLTTPDGLVDSLKYLIYHDNYIKPDSDEHSLVMMMLKAF